MSKKELSKQRMRARILKLMITLKILLKLEVLMMKSEMKRIMINKEAELHLLGLILLPEARKRKIKNMI